MEATSGSNTPSGSPRVGEPLGGAVSPTEEESGGVRKQVDWNVYWTDSGLNIDRVVRSAKVYQKVNHFPGMVNIYRKSNLARSMSKMVKINAKEYDFFPKTWVLPTESAEVMKYLNHNLTSAMERSARCVIIKPSGGAQGKGIYLCMHPQSLRCTEDAVAQVYVHRPLLINSFKFDLRIYALVTCVDPLRILLYKEGLVRLCTTPYKTPDVNNVGINYMHLTNYSVNKHNDTFVENNLDEEGDASKRSLSWLWQWMESQGHSTARVSRVWQDIGDVIVKTLISIQSTLAVNYASSKIGSANNTPFTCFEVLGFDILLTETLSPVLIEVNHTPSFRTDSALDAQVKEGLISDTLQVLNVASDDRHKYLLRSAALSQMRLYGDLFDESPRSRQRASRAQGDTSERQWESYLRNEKLFKGGFDVIYPATDSEDEQVRARQPMYEEMLRSAAETYWNSDLGKLVAVPPPPPPLQRASSPAMKAGNSPDPAGQSPAASGSEKGEREKKQMSAATRQKMLRDREREKLKEKEKQDKKRRSLVSKKKWAARCSRDDSMEGLGSGAEVDISDSREEEKGDEQAGAEATDIELQSVLELDTEIEVSKGEEGQETVHGEEAEAWIRRRVAALSTPSTASRLRGRRDMHRQENSELSLSSGENQDANKGVSEPLPESEKDSDAKDLGEEAPEQPASDIENENNGGTEDHESASLELRESTFDVIPPIPPPQHAIKEPIRPLRDLRTSTEKGCAPSPTSPKVPKASINGQNTVVAQAMGSLNEIEVLRARYSEYRNRWLQEYRDAAALRPLK